MLSGLHYCALMGCVMQEFALAGATAASRNAVLLATTNMGLAAAARVASRDTPAYEKDEVKSLPGWDEALPSRHFSGYLQASPTKRLHYYLVQSEGDWNKDPVVLWFNGGPGCSSLDGFLYEHGPFRVQYDGKAATLARFDYAWSKLATMVYIEAPCGVGFSYSTAKDTTRDYNATDDTAALDNLAAVESLFDKFPKLKSRDLYITGESYAGIYVPTLAEAIVAKGAAYTGARLKGIAVGNGCSGSEIGICAFGRSTQGSFYTTKFLLSSGFAPETLKDELREACAADFSTWAQGGPVSDGCSKKVDELGALTKDLDTYCVYCDCPQNPNPIDDDDYATRGQMQLAIPTIGTTACVNTYEASAYLNRADVRKALHVGAANVKNWMVCGSAEGWQYTSTRPNLPRDTYPKLKHLDVLIYNGDWDACVPYTDNEAWTLSMGYPITKPWRAPRVLHVDGRLTGPSHRHPWEYKDGPYNQIGGYAIEFDVPGRFVFTTVRGGRHEVPETAPDRAFEMLRRFLNGEKF